MARCSRQKERRTRCGRRLPELRGTPTLPVLCTHSDQRKTPVAILVFCAQALVIRSTSSRFLSLELALLVFSAATVFLLADLAFARRLGVVNAMLHGLGCAKEGEDRFQVAIGQIFVIPRGHDRA